jgi:hypothetical protein
MWVLANILHSRKLLNVEEIRFKLNHMQDRDGGRDM